MPRLAPVGPSATRAISAFAPLTGHQARQAPRLMRTRPRLEASHRKDIAMPNARLAIRSDLSSLIELYRISEVSASATPARAEEIWSEMLSHEDYFAVFVSSVDTRIVGTCMLITAPHLLRNRRRHGFLENVVAHPAFRGEGHGRAVVDAALAAAWAKNCHHVFLQSGRKDPASGPIPKFARSCGWLRANFGIEGH